MRKALPYIHAPLVRPDGYPSREFLRYLSDLELKVGDTLDILGRLSTGVKVSGHTEPLMETVKNLGTNGVFDSLDKVNDGITYVRPTHDNITGSIRAFSNIEIDGTYGTSKYHRSAFRQIATTNKSGNTATQASWITVASFVLHIPSGFTQYKGSLTVTFSPIGDTIWSCSGRIAVGAIASNVISFNNPTLTNNGVVALAGLTPDTDLTINVQVNFSSDNVGTCTGSFAQVSYVDQDPTNIQ